MLLVGTRDAGNTEWCRYMRKFAHICMNIARICAYIRRVSFCRPGKMAVSCHFFGLQRTFVWQNHTKLNWFFNWFWLIDWLSYPNNLFLQPITFSPAKSEADILSTSLKSAFILQVNDILQANMYMIGIIKIISMTFGVLGWILTL